MIKISDTDISETNVLFWQFESIAMQSKFIDINKHINMTSEPYEKILTSDVPLQIWNNKKIYTCNYKPVKTSKFKIINYPLFWMRDCFKLKKQYQKTKSKSLICLLNNHTHYRNKLYNVLKTNKDTWLSCTWEDLHLPSEKKLSANELYFKIFVPDEYFNSTWDIVTETGNITPHNIISEKTFRPLFLGKPFISFGFVSMYKELAKLGFIFEKELTKFDKNNKDRFDIFLNVVKKLHKTEPNLQIIEHNKKIAQKVFEESKKQQKLVDELNKKLRYKTFITKDMYEYLKDTGKI